MNVERLFPIVIPSLFAVLVLVESVRPARPLLKIPGWRLQGVAAFVLTGALSSAVPLLYVDFIRAHRLLDLEGMGLVPGALIALLCGELVGYWWHRARHRQTMLWRIHQMHHAAERLDVFGGSYFHPLDIVLANLVGGVTATMILGVSAQASATAGLFAICCGLFQHANVRTPRWLGYLIQRPEAHSVHHARGLHAYNYCDLPLWDMLFGTFRNPDRFETEAGFYDGATRRVGAMLLGRDVSSPSMARR